MEINFSKYSDGLVPAIVQDDQTGKVLMLGFMNQEALDKSQRTRKSYFLQPFKKQTLDQRVKKVVISCY